MLLRTSSDATSRSKQESCSASIKQRMGSAESSDHNGGYQGALIAANTAYQRAHGTVIPREKGRVANKLQKSRTNSSSEGSHLAQRHRRHQLRKSTSSDAALTAHQRVLRRYGVGNGDRNTGDGYHIGYEAQPEPSIVRAQDFLEADAQLGIQSTPEEAVASTPSSYRKLPKSAAATAPKSNGTTMQTQKPNTQRAEDGEAQFAENLLASIRSVKRPMGSEISYALSASDCGLSVAANEEQYRNLNRDKILRNFQQMKLRERPSFSSFVAKKRQDHASSYSANDGCGGIVTFHKENFLNQENSGQPLFSVGTESKVKDDSKSLKSRFKKMFRRSSQIGDGLPVQHLEATKLHFGSDIASISSSKRRSNSLSDSDEKKLLNESPEISFSMDIPGPKNLAGSRASSGMHSEGGDSNTKSRVTSWSNSTVANTLSSKPLSIINEYVSRAQSLTLSSRVVSGSSEQAQPISQPALAYGHTTEYEGIDARQLCSALMRNEAGKDLQRTKNSKQNYPPSDGVLKSVHHTLPSQSRNTSLGSIATRLRMPRSNGSRNNPEIPSSSHNQDVTNLHGQDSDSTPMLLPQKSPMQIAGHFTPRKDRLFIPKRRYEQVNEAAAPSAIDIARRVDRDQNRWRMNLEEAKVAGSVPVSRYERLSDNAKRAEDNSLELTNASYEDPDRTIIDLTNPTVHIEDELYRERSPNLRRWVKGFKSQPESDYSRLNNTVETVDGILTCDSGRIVPMDISNQREATSQAKQPARFLEDAAESRRHTDREMNKADKHLSSHSGHRRELTQITDTENTKQEISVAVIAPKKEVKLRPKLESRQTSRMNERFPIIETGRDQYLQAKSSTETVPTLAKKISDGGDKENQTTKAPTRENRLVHNKFQSLQAMKTTSINQTDRGRDSRTPDKLDIGDIRARKDYQPRPSPLRHHLSSQTNKTRSIVDLRSQSYDTTRTALSPSPSLIRAPSPSSSHLFKQIRRKPTAIVALHATAVVSSQAEDEPNLYNNAHNYAPSPIPTPDSREPQTPSPSPSRSRSRSRLGGSVTPTSGQRMADVFINSRRREQYNHLQQQQPPWLKPVGDSPVFL